MRKFCDDDEKTQSLKRRLQQRGGNGCYRPSIWNILFHREEHSLVPIVFNVRKEFSAERCTDIAFKKQNFNQFVLINFKIIITFLTSPNYLASCLQTWHEELLGWNLRYFLVRFLCNYSNRVTWKKWMTFIKN